MLESIKNFYHSVELRGEDFVFPLHSYHNFFAKKIHASEGLKKIALVIVNIATGIFAYAFLGLLAGIGTLIKLTDVSNLKIHNESQKQQLEKCLKEDHQLNSSDYVGARSTVLIPNFKQCSKYVLREVRVFVVNQETPPIDYKKEIDLLTNQFKKVYVFGSLEKNAGNKGQLVFRFKVNERV